MKNDYGVTKRQQGPNLSARLTALSDNRELNVHNLNVAVVIGYDSRSETLFHCYIPM